MHKQQHLRMRTKNAGYHAFWRASGSLRNWGLSKRHSQLTLLVCRTSKTLTKQKRLKGAGTPRQARYCPMGKPLNGHLAARIMAEYGTKSSGEECGQNKWNSPKFSRYNEKTKHDRMRRTVKGLGAMVQLVA